MKIKIFIFFINFLIITAQSANDNMATTLLQPNQNIGLYDYFRRRFKNLQNYYDADVDNVKKRTLNGKYVPLYDEFKKRLDNFNAAILLDKDKQSLANESVFNGCSDCHCAIVYKSNEDKLRSNRGFLKYFGFTKSAKEKDRELIKPAKSLKVSHKGQNKSKEKGGGKSGAYSENVNKGSFVEVKPGNLYDEYMKQIEKINDAVFTKDLNA